MSFSLIISRYPGKIMLKLSAMFFIIYHSTGGTI